MHGIETGQQVGTDLGYEKAGYHGLISRWYIRSRKILVSRVGHSDRQYVSGAAACYGEHP